VRTGPFTWLAALALAASGCAAAGPAGSDAVVHGVVMATPGCPVQRAISGCPPIRVAGALVVAVANRTQVGATHTAADGSFTLTLPIGAVTVTATGPGGYRPPGRQLVTVHPHQVGTLTIMIDSGIR